MKATIANLEVACPKCLSVVGTPCFTRSGRESITTHGERLAYRRDLKRLGQLRKESLHMDSPFTNEADRKVP